MTWSAPSALALSILSAEPTVVITVQPMRLASWIAAEPMPEPPAWTRIVSPGSSLRIVEQHVLDRAEGDRHDRRADRVDAGRGGHQQPRRQVDLLLGEAVEVEAVHAADVLAEIVALLAAGPAQPAGARAIDRNELAGHQAGDARADRIDLAGGLGADDQRHLALGKRHAAPAPDVDVVERHRLDAQRHLAMGGRWRRRQVDRLQPPVFDQLQCAHSVRLPGH